MVNADLLFWEFMTSPTPEKADRALKALAGEKLDPSEFPSGFYATVNNIQPFVDAKFRNAEPAQFEVISEENPCQY